MNEMKDFICLIIYSIIQLSLVLLNRVINYILSCNLQHVLDLVGEGYLLLSRGNVLVVAEVPKHVPAAGLALCGCLMSTLEVQLHLV